MATSRRGHGEGAVFYIQSRDRWAVEVDHGYVDGKRKRSRRQFRTRREATIYLADALKARNDGVPPPDARTRLGDFLDEWINTVVDPSNRAANTKVSYRDAVRLHIKPGLGHHRLIDLRHRHVQEFINERRSSGCGKSLMNTIMVVLRMALTRAVTEERINRNVATDVGVPDPLIARPAPRRLTRHERDTLLRNLRDDRLYAAFYLMAIVGLRRGEVLGLRVEDVDFEREVLHVRQQVVRVKGSGLVFKAPKREKARSLWLSDRSAQVIKERLRSRDREQELAGPQWSPTDLVFATEWGSAIDPGFLTHLMSAVCQRSGVAHATPHSLRRAFSDEAHALGVRDKDLQGALGHATLAQTMDGYVGDKPGTDREFAEIMDGSLRELDDIMADDLADIADHPRGRAPDPDCAKAPDLQ